MRRTLSFLLLGALAVLPACSSSGSTAASINGHDISVDEVTRGVRGFAQSPLFVQSLSQQGVDLRKTGPLPMSFASQWLISLLQNEAIAQVAKQKQVVASDQEIEQARAQYAGTDQNGQAFRELPKWLREEIIGTTALQLALRSALPAPQASQAELDSAYQQLVADCASQKLVGHILVATQAEAEQAIARLDAGETFGAVAAEVSTDTGSRAQGGLLMCEGGAQWEQLDATFRAGAEATPAGDVSAPVQTSFGFHVIGGFPISPETAAPLLSAAVQQQDPLADVVGSYVEKAKIWVNPRFGTLGPREGGSITIDPPNPKRARDLPADSPVGSTTLPLTPDTQPASP